MSIPGHFDWTRVFPDCLSPVYMSVLRVMSTLPKDHSGNGRGVLRLPHTVTSREDHTLFKYRNLMKTSMSVLAKDCVQRKLLDLQLFTMNVFSVNVSIGWFLCCCHVRRTEDNYSGSALVCPEVGHWNMQESLMGLFEFATVPIKLFRKNIVYPDQGCAGKCLTTSS